MRTRSSATTTSNTNDANIRVTWRALPNLTLVTRYDFQQTDIDNVAFSGLPGSTATTPKTQSGDITTPHLLGKHHLEPPRAASTCRAACTGSAPRPTPPQAARVPGVVPDWDNDYWSVSLNAGYALDDKTEIHGSYYYYHADNYVQQRGRRHALRRPSPPNTSSA